MTTTQKRPAATPVERAMAGMTEAMLHRLDARAQLTDLGREYGGMSVLEIGRSFLESLGCSTRGKDRFQLSGDLLSYRSGGMHGIGDFGALLANVANKRLRAAYEQAAPTYLQWARRAPDARDFKPMTVVQLSGVPELLRVQEHGEFTYGTMADAGETYAMVTYGRIVSLSRQAMINDDLRGFGRLIDAFGDAARRLENRLVYSQLTANAALSDGVALFHASHGNLTSGGSSALQASSLASGRAAMRVQKGLQGEVLNLSPAFLIVPASLEQTAYQLTSNAYVPAKASDVSEFRAGGRTALEPVVEPLLDSSSASAWYLAAASSQVDTVEYCYLNGQDGPVIEQKPGFETDGTSFKARLDFAAKAIDFRGVSKADGI